MQDEFPGNAHANPSRPTPRERVKKLIDDQPVAPEKKRVEPIADLGEVIIRKQSLGKRFFETFFGGDAKTVVGYVVMEVLIPSAKDMVLDAFTQGLERSFYGESRSSSRRTGSRGASSAPWTSYNRFSQPGRSREEAPRSISRASRSRHDFGEIVLSTRVKAERVLDDLIEVCSKFESATVADLYDLCEVTPGHTDFKWGWTDLRGADISRVREGYVLDLPRPEPLE